LTVELFVMFVLKMGLTIADLEYFTVGGIYDLIYAYADNQQQSRTKSDTREATQEDIDKLFK